jgi:ubiquitin-small subunit ribosomal protein S27Ae
MAAAKKGGKPAAKGGAAAKPKKKSYSVQNLYEVSGDELKRKRKTCPKCGPSFYLAEHANRTNCGKCGYTEFRKG